MGRQSIRRSFGARIEVLSSCAGRSCPRHNQAWHVGEMIVLRLGRDKRGIGGTGGASRRMLDPLSRRSLTS
jgi:hypothetical protein